MPAGEIELAEAYGGEQSGLMKSLINRPPVPNNQRALVDVKQGWKIVSELAMRPEHATRASDGLVESMRHLLRTGQSFPDYRFRTTAARIVFASCANFSLSFVSHSHITRTAQPSLDNSCCCRASRLTFACNFASQNSKRVFGSRAAAQP